MKSFNNLRPILAGEPLVFLKSGVRHNVSGVCSAPVSVYAQGESDLDATLFGYYPAGDFKFDVGHFEPFGIHFVIHGEGEVCVVRNPDSLLLTPSPDDTWSTYEHRPAVDPNMAAIQRQVMQLARGLSAAQAENARLAAASRIDDVQVIEPDPAPVAVSDPAPAEAPADAIK